jgi:hypothetical protein
MFVHKHNTAPCLTPAASSAGVQFFVCFYATDCIIQLFCLMEGTSVILLENAREDTS